MKYHIELLAIIYRTIVENAASTTSQQVINTIINHWIISQQHLTVASTRVDSPWAVAQVLNGGFHMRVELIYWPPTLHLHASISIHVLIQCSVVSPSLSNNHLGHMHKKFSQLNSTPSLNKLTYNKSNYFKLDEIFMTPNQNIIKIFFMIHLKLQI